MSICMVVVYLTQNYSYIQFNWQVHIIFDNFTSIPHWQTVDLVNVIHKHSI